MFKNKVNLVIVLVSLVAGLGIGWVAMMKSEVKTAAIPTEVELMTFSKDELSKYNGTDPSKSIYLAYEGFVYDITTGKDYYQTGGVYHFLAGKDSTAELNFAGGGLIKKKYKIIGRYKP